MIKNIKTKISDYWNSLSPRTQGQLVSAGKTFLASFVASVVVVSKTGIHWDVTFLGMVLTTGISNGIKALLESYAPPSLGGIK